MSAPTETHTLDLGPGDVHSPGGGGVGNYIPTRTPTASELVSAMSDLTTAQRNGLSSSQFADPGNRKYPIADAAHVRDAASRLEAEKGSLAPAKYKAIRSRIARAARRFGVDSEYNKKPSARLRGGKGLRMAITHPDGTRTEIRHMSAAVKDDTLFLFSVVSKSMLPAEGGSKRVWIQLATVGSWLGHPQGAFKLDASVFSSVIRNFKANPDGRVPIDFEHASEMPPTQGSIPQGGAPAQGWIYDLKADGSALFALVEWGDLAREYIQTDKYSYISPAIRFKAKDRVTGKPAGPTLSSAGLTNDPFLKGMMPLVASEHAAATGAREGVSLTLAAKTMCYSANEYMPRVRGMLKLHDLSTAQECSDKLSTLRDHLDAVDGDPTQSHEGVSLSDYLMPMRDMVQAPMGSTWDDVLDTVQDMIDAAMDDGQPAGAAPAASASMSDTTEPVQLTAAPATETPITTPEPVLPVSQANEAVDPPSTEVTTMSANAPQAPVAPSTTLTVAEATELQLKLRAAETEVTQLKDQVTTLSAKVEAREEQDRQTKVDVAFDTWKDKKGLTEAHKPALMVLLKASPESFDAMYPKVEADQRHLLRNFTGDPRQPQTPAQRPRVPADAPAAAEGEVVTTMSLRQLSFQLMNKHRMPLAMAQRKAKALLNSQRRARQETT